jgi:hypothetical protein
VIDVAVLENKTNQPRTEYGITIDPHSVAIYIVGGEDVSYGSDSNDREEEKTTQAEEEKR